MNSRLLRLRFFVLGAPALAGFAVMYLYPFIRSLRYSMIDNTFRQNFVFLDNYKGLLDNQMFRMAAWNTFVFSVVAVVCVVTLSVALSLGLTRLSSRFMFIKNILISPMIIPTASIIFVWQLAFQNDFYRELTRHAGGAAEFWTIVPIYLLYIWKNAGLNIIIISAAIAAIPAEIHEAAALDGAKSLYMHRTVTLPLIFPSLLFVIVLSFVGALRVFRESYLFFGTDYPPDIAYTVQYFMNNHFNRLNYPVLAAASVLFTVIIAAMLLLIYSRENRHSDKIY